MNNEDCNDFKSVNDNFFSCNDCRERCDCIFECGPDTYLMEALVDRNTSMCEISIYYYNNQCKGDLDFTGILPMIGDMVPIPEDYQPCLNPNQHCGCN